MKLLTVSLFILMIFIGFAAKTETLNKNKEAKKQIKFISKVSCIHGYIQALFILKKKYSLLLTEDDSHNAEIICENFIKDHLK